MAQEKTAAVYCRTAQKDDAASENQKAQLTRLANEQGYGRVLVFTDNGVSGATMNRPGFAAMNAAIDRGEIHSVLVSNLSRIGRNYIQTEQWIERLYGENVALIAADIGVLTGGVGYGA
jgi:DNA invertase Pin-like site-specific DNA recombinase